MSPGPPSLLSTPALPAIQSDVPPLDVLSMRASPSSQPPGNEYYRKQTGRPSVDVVRVLEEQGQQYMEHISALRKSKSNEDDMWEDVDEEVNEDVNDDVNKDIDQDINGVSEVHLPEEIMEVESNNINVQYLPQVFDTGTTQSEFDPFHYAPNVKALRTPDNVHPNCAVFLIYTLVVWLHTQWHLPFVACNALLLVLRLVLVLAGASIDPPLCITLTSALRALDIDPNPRILPVCIGCQQVFPADIAHDTTCSTCDKPLFNAKSSRPEQGRRKVIRTDPKPVLPPAIKSIQEQLQEMLLVAGFEKSLQSWRDVSRTPGVYHDIHNGAICKEIPDADGKPFYRKPPPDHELRIGLWLSLDW
jgi:hypothetical protein